MAHDRLDYSALRLFGFLALALLAAGFCVALILAADNLVTTRRLGPFALLGPDGARIVIGACGLFFLVGTAGLLRRLVGDRAAALVRHDGITLNGLFGSRRIGWADLNRLHLYSERRAGTVNHYIRVEDHAPWRAFLGGPFFAGGVSVQLLRGGVEDAAQWIDHARATRRRALAPPNHVAQAPRSIARTKVDFGRRVV